MKFMNMFCMAGVLLFVGLDHDVTNPKYLIMITGAVCGVANMLIYLLEKD